MTDYQYIVERRLVSTGSLLEVVGPTDIETAELMAYAMRSVHVDDVMYVLHARS